MEDKKRKIELEYRILAYEDALSIAEKSLTKREIKRHLKLRLDDLKREGSCIFDLKKEDSTKVVPPEPSQGQVK